MAKEKARKHNLSAVPSPEKTDRAATDLKDWSSEPDDSCPKCFGVGIEIVPGKGARPCECRQRDYRNRSLDNARLPVRYSRCHFHNYKCKTPSQEQAFKLALKLATEYPAVEQGLLLMGEAGVGKTHLAVAILKGLFERGISGLFYEFGSLLKEIQSSYDPKTETSEWRVLAPVLDADVLVLDELGASKPTLWVQDTMYHIINARYNDRKLTIFTTNYPDERLNSSREILDDRIGIRLRSRLHEMCRTVLISGEDYRKSFDRSIRIG